MLGVPGEMRHATMGQEDLLDHLVVDLDEGDRTKLPQSKSGCGNVDALFGQD